MRFSSNSNWVYIDIPLGALALYYVVRLVRDYQRSRHRLPLPPGPRGLPLLGNLLDMPKEKDWETFAKWNEEYGDLVSVRVFNQTFVFISSPLVASDLFDRQSSIYSDRPVLPMAGELMGWKNSMGFTPYGSTWRKIRRLSHQLLGTPGRVEVFHAHEEMETVKLLKRLLERPEALKEHLRKTAGAIILRISYGYQVKEGPRDPFVDLVNLAVEQVSQALAPGSFLVNLVPALLHLPEWFPGAGFKQIAKEWGKSLSDTVEKPYEYVKEQMASGTNETSFVSKLLSDSEKKLDSEEEFAIKWAAQSFYAAGSDTTVGVIYEFFKMMVLYPDVQAKAQEELDRVLGAWESDSSDQCNEDGEKKTRKLERLPLIKDRPHLPYVDALVKEVFRIFIVVPMGVPHMATEDNIYKGYFIPKGAICFANIWKMTHDPVTYPDPMTFNPERFLGPNPQKDPRELMFGFGRRICAGLHLADLSVFISCAMVLATFNIDKAYDETSGAALIPEEGSTSGAVV
ncbi:hypothetical protein D9758_005204 [Tetrapyrgos nigripes]|uniref:Cytochrome P450 n=1 Tax=Tetrapyrgos nigripes TaxID=182062 RepID=A0A8H5GWZ4_9AGAR|nr:hypothetical protein D9758_005204 [Tetrapyrgos nigripes]